jgi:hypothetical protein
VKLLRAVLNLMDRQGQLDLHVEETKGPFPAAALLESLFAMLDLERKGYVTDKDLWQFARRFHSLPFSSMFTLILEVQHGRRCHEPNAASGRLSWRDIGIMLCSKGTAEYEALVEAASDDNARTALYLHHHTEACPGCGLRSQRDSDPTDCPEVVCLACGLMFRCVNLEANSLQKCVAVPTSAQHELFRIIHAITTVTEKVEALRRQLLADWSTKDLAEAFGSISGGKPTFSFTDLRRALFEHRFWSSERELQLLWMRYTHQCRFSASGGSSDAGGVTLAAFLRQLQPLAMNY